MSELPFAWGGPPLRGTLRAAPEDFFVDEELGFAADGAGEHVLVRVEKRGANTDWVARELAKFAGVRADAVSYAGLKDRHALTRQTFSVHLPGKQEPDWPSLAHEEFRVLEHARHSRKIKRGALDGNRFRIVVRDIQGDPAHAERALNAIAAHGVPNYFGEQRFGRDAANVERARAMFAGRRVPRHEHSLLLSAARSQVFNALLARRVERGEWNRPLDGDVFMLAGSHSIFGPEPLTDALAQRCAQGDIAPTGAMWGAGELRSSGSTAELETGEAAAYPDLCAGLVANGLKQERRALVLRPANMVWQTLPGRAMAFEFSLSSGSYATVLLRELVAS